MNFSALFSAISDSIIISMVYGLTLYFLLKFSFNFAKQINPEWKYRIFYGLMVLIFLSFLISVVRLYIVNQYIPDHIIYFRLTDLEKSSATFDFRGLIKNNSLWIGTIYLAGILIQSIFLASGLLKIRNLKNQQKTDLNIFWDERLVALKQKLELGKSVMLFFSKTILVPLTVGFVKPVILFPAAMLNHLSIEEVESILLHELAHIKRNDYGLNLFQRIMEIILFFNPAAWLLAKDIKREREFCCDDLVIGKNINPRIYASALASLASNRENISLALSANGTGNYPLLNRIQRITTMKSLNNPKQQVLTTLGILAIGLSLAWAIPSDTSGVKINIGQDTLLKAPPAPEAIMPVPPLAPPPPPEFKKLNKKSAPQLSAPPAPATPGFIMMPSPPTPPAMDTTELKNRMSTAEWKKQMEAMKLNAEEMK
ncbi:MAG: M56 family metallopeptidase, partial [Daejeonella sp.]